MRSTIGRVTPSMVGGFHFGFWSLSIRSARTPSKKSWSGRMARCDMRYSMVIVSSNERLAQRLSCSRVMAIESGESFIRAVSCLAAHSPGCFLSLASISATNSAEKQRSISGVRARQGGHAGILGEAGDHGVDLALGAGPRQIGGAESGLQVVHVGARHMGVDDAGPQRVRRLQAMTGERQERAQRARQPRQEIAAADIGKEADCRLRHGEQEFLARHRVRAVRGEADAAAHVDAVDQRDPRLGETIDAAVDDVFVAEEVAPQRARGIVAHLG